MIALITNPGGKKGRKVKRKMPYGMVLWRKIVAKHGFGPAGIKKAKTDSEWLAYKRSKGKTGATSAGKGVHHVAKSKRHSKTTRARRTGRKVPRGFVPVSALARIACSPGAREAARRTYCPTESERSSASARRVDRLASEKRASMTGKGYSLQGYAGGRYQWEKKGHSPIMANNRKHGRKGKKQKNFSSFASFLGRNPLNSVENFLSSNPIAGSATAGLSPSKWMDVLPMAGGVLGTKMLTEFIVNAAKSKIDMSSGVSNYALEIASAGLLGAAGGMFSKKVGHDLFIGGIAHVMGKLTANILKIAVPGLQGVDDGDFEFGTSGIGISDFASPNNIDKAANIPGWPTQSDGSMGDDLDGIDDFASPTNIGAAKPMPSFVSQYPLPTGGSPAVMPRRAVAGKRKLADDMESSAIGAFMADDGELSY